MHACECVDYIGFDISDRKKKYIYIWLKDFNNGEVRSLFVLLRSTKWNASLILVALCKVMFWKTHIPVRKQKWPPR